MLTGAREGLVYSLSRWTDIPGSPTKWAWFLESLKKGYMQAIDPRTGLPGMWSLKPEDTLGLELWTKNPTVLLSTDLLKDYDARVHVTVTGWEEVEKGAPTMVRGATLLARMGRRYGWDRVRWRFSPIPSLSSREVLARYSYIAFNSDERMGPAYVSFLQGSSDWESRDMEQKHRLLYKMQTIHPLRLCADDPLWKSGLPMGVFQPGICSDRQGPKEACGCALAVDPFTIGEGCGMSCLYCYSQGEAAKRDTTKKRLPTL